MDKKIEKIFCYIVSIIVLVLLILTIKKIIFLPALLLMTSLLLFGLSYTIRDSKKKWLIYTLFIIGVILVISAISYLIWRLV